MIVQECNPTTEGDEKEIEQMFQKIEMRSNRRFERSCREEESGSMNGRYWFVRKNEREEQLIEFCKKNQLVATNTCFQQH